MDQIEILILQGLFEAAQVFAMHQAVFRIEGDAACRQAHNVGVCFGRRRFFAFRLVVIRGNQSDADIFCMQTFAESLYRGGNAVDAGKINI